MIDEQQLAYLKERNMTIYAMGYVNPMERENDVTEDMLMVLYMSGGEIFISLLQTHRRDVSKRPLDTQTTVFAFKPQEETENTVDEAKRDCKARLQQIADENKTTFEFYEFEDNEEALHTLVMFNTGIRFEKASDLML